MSRKSDRLERKQATASSSADVVAIEPAVAEELDESRIGRPQGSKTQERPAVVFLPPHCPTCQSTRRSPFRDGPVADDRIEVEIGGRRYNRELWRNTSCLDCGQSYRVIEYRFEPEAETISHEMAG